MKNNLLEYVRNSKENAGIYYLNDIPVWTEDPLPDSINLRQVLLDVAKRLPKIYLKYIQAVRIGIFEEMLEKELNALYPICKITIRICLMI